MTTNKRGQQSRAADLPAVDAPYGAVPDTAGLNYYRADPNLAAALQRYLPPDLFAHAGRIFDEAGAGGELAELAAVADKNQPQLVQYDQRGRRVDRIVKHPAYVAMERIVFERFRLNAVSHVEGLLGWPGRMPPIMKYALSYVLVQAEFGLFFPPKPPSGLDPASLLLRCLAAYRRADGHRGRLRHRPARRRLVALPRLPAQLRARLRAAVRGDPRLARRCYRPLPRQRAPRAGCSPATSARPSACWWSPHPARSIRPAWMRMAATTATRSQILQPAPIRALLAAASGGRESCRRSGTPADPSLPARWPTLLGAAGGCLVCIVAEMPHEAAAAAPPVALTRLGKRATPSRAAAPTLKVYLRDCDAKGNELRQVDYARPWYTTDVKTLRHQLRLLGPSWDAALRLARAPADGVPDDVPAP